jgi:hypothetical protein
VFFLQEKITKLKAAKENRIRVERFIKCIDV